MFGVQAINAQVYSYRFIQGWTALRAIDSSLIVSLMQQEKTTPIKTFTVGFEDSQFDESKYAKAISNHLGTDHSEIFVSDKESQDAISLLPEIYDEPFSDASQIPTLLLSRVASAHPPRKYSH